MFISKEEVKRIFEDAIINRKILKIKYQHISIDNEIVEHDKAPFDLGTTNPKTQESNKDNAYLFCFGHKNDFGREDEKVHPISSRHIISIEDTGRKFDENELAEINLKNTGYNYKQCEFALLPNRNWFK